MINDDTYKGPAKETDVRNHGPNNGCQIWNGEESRPVSFYEERHDGIATEIENYEANVE